MKTLLIVILFFMSCSQQATKVEINEPNFYYVPCFKNNSTKPNLSYEEINHVDSNFELLASELFIYKDHFHNIKLYCDDKTAEVDGGTLEYTLDSIGIIYASSSTWPNFVRLESRNDSINDLISAALGYIIWNQSLHCYHCDDRFNHLNK